MLSPAAGNISALTNGSTKFSANTILTLIFSILWKQRCSWSLSSLAQSEKSTRSSRGVIEAWALTPGLLLHNGIVSHEEGNERCWSLITLDTQILCTHPSSAFSKPENCPWPLTSPALGIEGMYLDLVFYRKCVSSFQLLAWCTAKIFFFSNEENDPIHFRYVKLLIPDFWEEMLQDRCHLFISSVSSRKNFTTKDSLKNPTSVEMNSFKFQFYLNSSCLFYTMLDKADSTNSAVIS